MALALGFGMPDATIEAGEQSAVALSLSGLDADATAIVTILDGAGGSVSAALPGDGTAVLDVSALSDGAATTRVTATDAEGNTTTITGPGLTLDFAPDTPAVADGNLTQDTVAEPVPQAVINGTSVNDWITGTGADDLIFGGTGRDRIRGADGNDTLDGGAGADNLGGGAGADTFIWGLDGLDGGRDRVEDFTPGDGDIIDLSPISAAYGWDAATAQAAVSVTDSFLGVTISIDVPGTGPISMAELRDMAPDQISVTAGTLRLVAETQPEKSVNDSGSLAITVPDTILAPDNIAEPVPDTVLTPDTVTDLVPLNEITGTSRADWMTGTSGGDLIFGGAGRDRIRGDDGNDTLDGGAGADNLGGGAGADTFVWGPDGLDGGRDRVEDFALAEGDIIDMTAISAFYGWDMATAQAAVSVKSSYLGVTISVDAPGTGSVSVAELRGMIPDQISVEAGTLRLVSRGNGSTEAGFIHSDGELLLPEPLATDVFLL
jgi:Ca2+-binding RTX toxin-like protein